MEEARDSKSSSVVNIATDGDVILVVGLEEVKLCVHSLFLKAASKPFAAMLGPYWKEGHKMLDWDGPVEVSLPNDDATALKLICAVIHHRTDMVPQNLAADNILGIAVTADKYDYIDALRLVKGNWLRPEKSEASDLILLASAAYLLQNAHAFKEITRALVLNYHGSYLDLSCEEVESAMSWRVFCLLEGQRSFAKLRLAEILLSGINDGIGTCPHRCGWTSKYAYAYLKLLEHKELWPARLHHISISTAINLVEKMPDPIPEESSVACKYGYKHAAPEYRRGRSGPLDNLISSLGLCLHCVRSGSTDFDCCNNSHSAKD